MSRSKKEPRDYRSRFHKRHEGNYKCFYCNDKLERSQVTIEHYRPKSLRGGNEMDNLKPCCSECNNNHGAIAESIEHIYLNMKKLEALYNLNTFWGRLKLLFFPQLLRLLVKPLVHNHVYNLAEHREKLNRRFKRLRNNYNRNDYLDFIKEKYRGRTDLKRKNS